MPGMRHTRKGGRRGRRARRRRTQKQREGSQARYARSKARKAQDVRLRAKAMKEYLDSLKRELAKKHSDPVKRDQEYQAVQDAMRSPFLDAEMREADRAKQRSHSHRRRHPKSVATVSLGGVFDEPLVGPKSKSKRQSRRKEKSGSSSPRKIFPAHVMSVEDAFPIYPARPHLTAAEEKESAARGRASFEEAVRRGEIITGNLEENKGEGYRNYLDRLERRMEHPGATVDIGHGDLILPIKHEDAQWALRSGRGRVRLRPGMMHVPAVSSKMGGPTYLERHTGTGRAVGRSQRSDGRKKKKEPGRYVRMWNLKPGDLGQ